MDFGEEMTPRALELNEVPVEEFVRVLGPVYEHSPHFAERVAMRRPFASANALRAAFKAVVDGAGDGEKLALIRAHPDLVGRAVLTAESQEEQASAGLTNLSKEETEKFRAYNEAYREKFGIPFIICVRLNKKDAIMEAFPRRLQNDIGAERETALIEIHKIAALRLHDILWEN